MALRSLGWQVLCDPQVKSLANHWLGSAAILSSKLRFLSRDMHFFLCSCLQFPSLTGCLSGSIPILRLASTSFQELRFEALQLPSVKYFESYVQTAIDKQKDAVLS